MDLNIAPPRLFEAAELPSQAGWLLQQSVPVIAVGKAEAAQLANADLVLADESEWDFYLKKITQRPVASLVLVQLLRSCETLSIEAALNMESMAYATLQQGEEFKSWLASRSVSGAGTDTAHSSEAISLRREKNILYASLNRAASRNAMTVEMRDALVEVLELLAIDRDIEHLYIDAQGACFSIGGALEEFGSTPDAAVAHWVRTVQSPARLLAQLSEKVSFRVHGACIGSGIELPAFGVNLSAHRKTFFQLPELAFGLIPGAGGTVSIARRIGRHRLAAWVVSGKRITSETALQWGLIDHIVD